MRNSRKIAVQRLDPIGQIGTRRFNHLSPPVNNPGVRRAVLRAVRQTDFVTRSSGRTRCTRSTGSPSSRRARLMPRRRGGSGSPTRRPMPPPRDVNWKRPAIEASAWWCWNRPLSATSAPSRPSPAICCADRHECGCGRLERPGAAPLPRGVGGTGRLGCLRDLLERSRPVLAGRPRLPARQWPPTGPGWPARTAIETARTGWLDATDAATRAAALDRLQRAALQDAPCVPLGQVFHQTAYRRDLGGMPGIVPAFRGVRRGWRAPWRLNSARAASAATPSRRAWP